MTFKIEAPFSFLKRKTLSNIIQAVKPIACYRSFKCHVPSKGVAVSLLNMHPNSAFWIKHVLKYTVGIYPD